MLETVSATDLDLTNAAKMGDRLLPLLDTLRETDPIHWNKQAQSWVITRHEDIKEALSGRLPISNQRFATVSLSAIPVEEWPEKLPTLVKYGPYHITNMDAPQHTRMRALLTRAFGRPVVEAMRPFAQAAVAELMRALRETDGVEFAELALTLPGRVILKLLGLPDELYPRLRVWANDVMVGLGTAHPEAEWVIAADRAFGEITEYCQVQINERRASPPRPDDFISSLVYAKNGQDGLSDEEIIAVLHVAVIAGHDTTANSMTLGVAALARQPQAWAYMRAHPERILDSVLEIMRYSAMSTAQTRSVAADFEWHGKQIKKGDAMLLMVAAGNRDPRMYAQPQVMDLNRRNDESLTFAPGLHHCIGHLLAKMQLTEFFGALVREFAGAEILNDEVAFAPILVFRAILSLRMRFQPYAGA